jgi:predicted dehydrogenase
MTDTRPVLGVVGCGWVMQTCYAPHLAGAAGRFAVGPLFDPNNDSALKTERDVGGWLADDLTGVFGACDAVLIASPNDLHFNQACKAINAGRHVLIEKPACISVAQTAILADAAAQAKVGIMAANASCCRRDVAWVLQQAKAIGIINRIELVWHRRFGAPAKDWHHVATAGWTGVFPDLGVHLVDIAGAILGYPQEPVGVTSARWDHDSLVATAGWHGASRTVASEVPAAAELAFAIADVTVTIAVAWQTSVDGDHTTIKIFGDKGQVAFDGLLGCSNDHVLNQIRTCHWDQDGRLTQAAEFPVGPSQHIEAFGEMLRAFEVVIADSDSSQFRHRAGFVAAFCEQASMSAELWPA